ncbi:Conserved_hypothetical protein [Hexamita inflata]|uniref:Uncharacterized protein n=1 Tax=Hexamita inflata TaxID=28002 RepID=A0AA86PFU2_9EUKA|nr:Conserved hypothetical protein [Hexamita inflata]
MKQKQLNNIINSQRANICTVDDVLSDEYDTEYDCDPFMLVNTKQRPKPQQNTQIQQPGFSQYLFKPENKQTVHQNADTDPEVQLPVNTVLDQLEDFDFEELDAELTNSVGQISNQIRGYDRQKPSTTYYQNQEQPQPSKFTPVNVKPQSVREAAAKKPSLEDLLTQSISKITNTITNHQQPSAKNTNQQETRPIQQQSKQLSSKPKQNTIAQNSATQNSFNSFRYVQSRFFGMQQSKATTNSNQIKNQNQLISGKFNQVASQIRETEKLLNKSLLKNVIDYDQFSDKVKTPKMNLSTVQTPKMAPRINQAQNQNTPLKSQFIQKTQNNILKSQIINQKSNNYQSQIQNGMKNNVLDRQLQIKTPVKVDSIYYRQVAKRQDTQNKIEQLRQLKQSQETQENLTFTPKINERPAYLSKLTQYCQNKSVCNSSQLKISQPPVQPQVNTPIQRLNTKKQVLQHTPSTHKVTENSWRDFQNEKVHLFAKHPQPEAPPVPQPYPVYSRPPSVQATPKKNSYVAPTYRFTPEINEPPQKCSQKLQNYLQKDPVERLTKPRIINQPVFAEEKKRISEDEMKLFLQRQENFERMKTAKIQVQQVVERVQPKYVTKQSEMILKYSNKQEVEETKEPAAPVQKRQVMRYKGTIW